jgi:hypothetical protein
MTGLALGLAGASVALALVGRSNARLRRRIEEHPWDPRIPARHARAYFTVSAALLTAA